MVPITLIVQLLGGIRGKPPTNRKSLATFPRDQIKLMEIERESEEAYAFQNDKIV